MASQSGDLQGKVALITGGTSGIGRDTAILFAKHGAKVALTGRRKQEGEEAAKLARAAGGEAIFLQGDVSQAADVQMFVQTTVEKFGHLDVAFNNAGIEGKWIPIAEMPEETFDQVSAINTRGVWLCLKYEMQQMLKQERGGAIVNMSSVAGLMGNAGSSAYCASKHAVIGLSRTAALEGAAHGIRVNTVCPAVIVTAMAERAFGADLESNRRMLGMHPIGRFGKPMEIAEAVLWMCSEKSSFMTGHEIVLDGGMLAGPNPAALDG
jgi:NAD(P)-dependent dehydrogenase (short-subunit alcohol dehydrogenase family)